MTPREKNCLEMIGACPNQASFNGLVESNPQFSEFADDRGIITPIIEKEQNK